MDFNSLNTGIILLNTTGTKICSLNAAAAKILGWDIKTLNENFSELGKLSNGLSSLSKVLKNLELDDQFKKIEVSINGQHYNLYAQQSSEGVLLELTQIIYQDMKQSTHELKRPIQNIKTLTETLLLGAKNDSQKCEEYLSKINYEVDRLGTMVQDMLSLSHVLSGSIELEKTEFDLYTKVDKLLSSASSRAESKRIELINKVPKSATIIADTKFFDHMLANLIDNAIKYNNDQGKVIVEFSEGLLIVQDSGKGIPETDLDKVFEQFYRVKETQSIQGSGLGLAIVKAIVDLHGWKINIKSKLQEGTSFIVKM